MSQSNKQLALSLAVQSLGSSPCIERNQGDWVIELARRYESFLGEGSTENKFSVVLHNHGSSVLNTIRLVKDLTGMDFFSSKEFVAQLPAVIKNGIGQDEAIMIKNHFSWSGCLVTIEKCQSR